MILDKGKDIVRFIVGLVLITIIMAIPHNLFGFDILSYFSIFSFLLLGAAFFFWNLRIYKILLILYCAFVPVLCLQYTRLKEEIYPELWTVIYRSSFREAWEFAAKERILIIIGTLVTIIVTSIISGKTFPKRISIGKAITFLFIALPVIIVCAKINGKRKFEGTFRLGIKTLQPVLYPSTLLYQVKRRKELVDFRRYWENYRFGTTPIAKINDTTRKLVVLVIGESSRYDHWSINEYGRNTNPLLAKERHVYAFRNVAAPAGATIYSIPMIMVAGDPYHFEEHGKYRGVIDAFKEGGFHTIYLTNQDESNSKSWAMDFHYDVVDSFYNTDVVFHERGWLEKQYDEKVLPILHRVIKDNDGKGNIFICIHLMGSHQEYSKRYPPTFSIFKVNDGLVKPNGFGYDKEIADYDNSILYSDYILSEIISSLKTFPGDASLIFTSDHGENLMDNDKKEMAHGVQPNKYLLHIPYFVWLNDHMVQRYPQYDSLLKAHLGYPLSAGDNTLFTLLHLGGMYPEREKQKFEDQSILSPQLKYSPQRAYAPFMQKITFKDLQQ